MSWASVLGAFLGGGSCPLISAHLRLYSFLVTLTAQLLRIPQVFVGDLLCARLIEQAAGQPLKSTTVWRAGPTCS